MCSSAPLLAGAVVAGRRLSGSVPRTRVPRSRSSSGSRARRRIGPDRGPRSEVFAAPAAKSIGPLFAFEEIAVGVAEQQVAPRASE